MQLIFFVPPNEELDIAPPKMKVKGYMYPQMKRPVGMLTSSDLMVQTAKVAFALVFQMSRGIQIMTRYDKIVIKSEISETILNI